MATTLREKPTAKHDAFIAAQLDRARQRIRLLDLATALGGWAAGTLAYLLLMMLLDRAFLRADDPSSGLPAGTRQLAFFLYLLASAAYLWLAVVRPLRWRVNPYYAARQLEGTLPGSRNHVINWIDLHEEKVPGVIRTALGARAAKDLASTDVEQAISSRRAVAVGAALGLLLAAFLVLFPLFGPKKFASLLTRAFGDSAGIATRTQIAVVRPEGGNATVNIGSAVTIAAEVTGREPSPHDKDAPCLLYRHDENEPFRRRPLQYDEFTRYWSATVAPLDVRDGFTYKLTAGDAETPEYRVGVRAAPLIADFVATYRYRPYVQKADRSRVTRKIEDLAGTEVLVLARTNRVVKDGRLDLETKEGLRDFVPPQLLPDDPQALRFRFVLARSGSYRIRFTSAEGEAYLDPIAYEVIAHPDVAPVVTLTKPGKDTTEPANGHVELAGEASDDHGVAALALKAQVVGGPPLQPKPYLADRLGKGDFGTPRRLEYKDMLDLAALKDEQGKPAALKPGMQVEYWLEAQDACDFPKPNVGVSQKYKVTIAEPKPGEEKKKEQAKQRQQEQQKQQEQQLKNEKKERDQQRQKDEKQEQEEQRQREQKGKEDKEKDKEGKEKSDKSDQDKGNAKEKKDGGESDQPDNKKDDETRKQAEQLKEALDKREQEKNKGEGKDREKKADQQPGDKGEGDRKPEDGKKDDKPGEAKEGGRDAEKAGEKKEGDAKGGDDKKPGQARDAGPPDAKDAKDGGKEGGKRDASGQQKPGEAKPDQPMGGQEKKPANDVKPGDKVKPGEAKDAKTEGKPTGEERPAEAKPGAKPDTKPGEGKPADNKDNPSPSEKPGEAKPSDKKPDAKGDSKDAKPGEKKDGREGEKKGDGEGKGDPRDATKADVERLAKEMKGKDAERREQAKRDLGNIRDQASDADTREAARKALEEAGKDDKGGQEKSGEGPAKAQPGEKKPGEKDAGGAGKQPAGKEGKEKKDGDGKGEAEGKSGEGPKKDGDKAQGKEKADDTGNADRPGEGLKNNRRPGESKDDGEAQPPRKEKPARHRASTLQLEEFRKKVSPDVLKDAKMSPEQFKKFLEDYAELARRQEQAGDEADTPPPPGRSGALPSMGGKAIKPGGKSGDVRGEGRAKPPPEYRDAHERFLQRLLVPPK